MRHLALAVLLALSACAVEAGPYPLAYSPPADCEAAAWAWCEAQEGCSEPVAAGCHEMRLELCRARPTWPENSQACIDAIGELCVQDGVPVACVLEPDEGIGTSPSDPTFLAHPPAGLCGYSDHVCCVAPEHEPCRYGLRCELQGMRMECNPDLPPDGDTGGPDPERAGSGAAAATP